MKTISAINTLNKQIGEQIEYIRLLKKKTVKEMMARLDLTESGYRNIERGITGISVERLFKIASILNFDYKSLLPINNKDQLLEEDALDKLKKQIGENYELRIMQYKEENNFLKKRIEMLENLLSNK